ncbi:MAG: SET domain-containing protein [Puniceicoccaceae bacterium]|nr:MAG: SET domain-containing protein [Puniceicoccaceae bacterium]
MLGARPKKSIPAPPEARARNPWIRICNSGIHGRGVFAARAIPKDTRILAYYGERITKTESLRRAVERLERARKRGGGAVYIFDLNSRHDIDGAFPWNKARLVNHSCEPNCEAQNIRGKIWVVALRDIAAGEELTYDYGYELEHWEDHPCRCGTPSCPGYIVHRKYRGLLRRNLARRAARKTTS